MRARAGKTTVPKRPRRKQGGFTVYTREAEAFADIYPQAGGTRVDYYAQSNDTNALRRRAAAATCL